MRAGATPKAIPTNDETPKDKIIEEIVTLAGKKMMTTVPKYPKRILVTRLVNKTDYSVGVCDADLGIICS